MEQVEKVRMDYQRKMIVQKQEYDKNLKELSQKYQDMQRKHSFQEKMLTSFKERNSKDQQKKDGVIQDLTRKIGQLQGAQTIQTENESLKKNLLDLKEMET